MWKFLAKKLFPLCVSLVQLHCIENGLPNEATLMSCDQISCAIGSRMGPRVFCVKALPRQYIIYTSV